MERAIKDGALCKYKYYPIPVVLEMDELEEYSELTEKIKKFVIEENGKIKISEDGKLLVFKRSRLLAKARQKIPTLLKLMENIKMITAFWYTVVHQQWRKVKPVNLQK